jgi:DNA-binding XRE family transcriptional regulator
MGTVHALARTPEWTWADRIRKVRRELGLTQKQFAELIAVSPQAIGLWEAGNYEPRQLVEVAKRIERQTGVSAAWMLGLQEGRSPDGTAERARRDSNSQPSDPKTGTSHLRLVRSAA